MCVAGGMCSTASRTAKIPQTKKTTEATPARAASAWNGVSRYTNALCVLAGLAPRMHPGCRSSVHVKAREKVHGIRQAHAQNGKADTPRKRLQAVGNRLKLPRVFDQALR